MIGKGYLFKESLRWFLDQLIKFLAGSGKSINFRVKYLYWNKCTTVIIFLLSDSFVVYEYQMVFSHNWVQFNVMKFHIKRYRKWHYKKLQVIKSQSTKWNGITITFRELWNESPFTRISKNKSSFWITCAMNCKVFINSLIVEVFRFKFAWFKKSPWLFFYINILLVVFWGSICWMSEMNRKWKNSCITYIFGKSATDGVWVR